MFGAQIVSTGPGMVSSYSSKALALLGRPVGARALHGHLFKAFLVKPHSAPNLFMDPFTVHATFRLSDIEYDGQTRYMQNWQL